MASSPSIPDPNQAAVAGALAQAGTFPFQQYIDYLAQTGGSGSLQTATGPANYNFTGLGNAQQNAALSQVMLPAELNIQQQYGPQYIQQALANLQQANPNAVAERQQKFNNIISNAQSTPNRPMATDLQNQILALTGQGSNLTTGPNSETEAVQQSVRGPQVASGIYLGNAPASQEASAVVNAGDQQQQQRQQHALDFLQSGVSPEDVTYRRVQQSLSNLGNAINGQTPEAQFQSLSGAAAGAAPFNTAGVQSPSINTNSSLQGLQNASDIYSGNVNWAENQANPWTVGLSSLAGGASILNSSGALNSNGLFGSNGPLFGASSLNTIGTGLANSAANNAVSSAVDSGARIGAGPDMSFVNAR
jgi:hypothetical protein